MNPFNKNSFSKTSFSDEIRVQLSPLSVGESVKVNSFGKDLRAVRMTIKYISDSINAKFKTKADENGELWVMRVA